MGINMENSPNNNEIQQINESTWDEFLKAWPPQRVEKMTLEEYTEAGSKDTFTYWIEARLALYGSIWGGSSFKFGVYSRADKDQKRSNKTRSYTEKYAWYTRDGRSPEEAFEKTKQSIVTIINCIKQGKIKEIDDIELGPAYKWKIAFHYQDRKQPQVVAIFKHPVLASICGKKPKVTDISQYHQELISKKNKDENVLSYSRRLWLDHEDVAGIQGEVVSLKDIPLNLILYGIPGSGKTYSTVNQALSIICRSDADLNEKIGQELSSSEPNRQLLEEEFYRLIDEKRISFLTFHPSYTYEDFIHGIRPVLDSGSESVAYELKDGPFKRIAAAARSEFSRTTSTYAIPEESRVYKMSLGNSLKKEDIEIFEFCIENDVIAHGFGGDNDFSFLNEISKESDAKKKIKAILLDKKYNEDNINFAAQVIWRFSNELREGDIVVVSKGNTKIRAIGRIVGQYEFRPDEEIKYCHFRKVEWIIEAADIPADQLLKKNLSQQTLYSIDKNNIHLGNLKNYTERHDIPEVPRNYVMIIDEINRGNIPRIFGELITLLEPDKRLHYKDGELTGLTVELPGALDNEPRFGIPSNLYVIGTMNTADRSITTLDLALRRRFSFKPMYPRYELIEDDFLRELLEKLNANIRNLKDQDHQIGHSYFLNKESADLAEILNENVLPLLEEYFFNDGEQIMSSFKGINFPDGKLDDNEGLLIRYVEA